MSRSESFKFLFYRGIREIRGVFKRLARFTLVASRVRARR